MAERPSSQISLPPKRMCFYNKPKYRAGAHIGLQCRGYHPIMSGSQGYAEDAARPHGRHCPHERWPRYFARDRGRPSRASLLHRELGPSWLGRARRAAAGLGATTRAARGASHSVYVVLLYDVRRADPWGLYVGQTSRDPDWRFDQHKQGYKSSGAVRRFGGSAAQRCWLFFMAGGLYIRVLRTLVLPSKYSK